MARVMSFGCLILKVFLSLLHQTAWGEKMRARVRACVYALTCVCVCWEVKSLIILFTSYLNSRRSIIFFNSFFE